MQKSFKTPAKHLSVCPDFFLDNQTRADAGNIYESHSFAQRAIPYNEGFQRENSILDRKQHQKQHHVRLQPENREIAGGAQFSTSENVYRQCRRL